MKKLILFVVSVCLLAAAGQVAHNRNPLPGATVLTDDPMPMCPPGCSGK